MHSEGEIIPSIESGNQEVPPEINEDDIVVTSHLRKSYKLQDGREVTVLRNITLDNSVDSFPVKRGEFVIIRGPSGSGKTSLLNLIGTIDQSRTEWQWENKSAQPHRHNRPAHFRRSLLVWKAC